MATQNNKALVTPEVVLAAIRLSMPDADSIFTNGRCFQLYRLLAAIWKQAECWYDPIDGHAYTKINETYYDIRGSRTLPKAAHRISMEDNPTLFADAHTWR